MRKHAHTDEEPGAPSDGETPEGEPRTADQAEAEAPAEPTTPEERVTALEAALEDVNARLLRSQADYQNLRRRSLSDLESNLRRHVQPLLEELLLVLDFLDMALASPAESEEARNLVVGVQMTRTKFVQALQASDVEEIPTQGRFDPGVHDASETRPGKGVEPGTILETLRKGYTWQGRVLRPAQVVVASEPGAADED
jgi:molecular chaperone GrpE